jgi:hypothetical protein
MMIVGLEARGWGLKGSQTVSRARIIRFEKYFSLRELLAPSPQPPMELYA